MGRHAGGGGPRKPLEMRMAAELASDSGGLLVVAAGMGAERALAAFLSPFTRTRSQLVLLLNASVELERAVDGILTTSYGAAPVDLPSKLHLDVSPRERAAVYAAGGVCSVTARHLCVDVLQNRVPLSAVAGVVVWSCFDVDSEDHPVAFALRLLRRCLHSKERPVQHWVRAVSDDPAAFVKHRLTLASLMRALGTRRISLYPRFHVAARQSLDQRRLAVVELKQRLPESVSNLQRDLLAIAGELCVELCVLLEPVLPAAITRETVNAKGLATGLMFRSLRCELRSVWDQVPPAAFRLIDELTDLRALLQKLHSDSCVDFMAAVEDAARRGNGGTECLPDKWLGTSAAARLIPAARNRVFIAGPYAPGAKRGRDEQPRLVLEKCSRMQALREVLGEIRKEWAANGAGFSHRSPGGSMECGRIRPTCLVLVRDGRTRRRVSHSLSEGGEQRLLIRHLRMYLSEQLSRPDLSAESRSEAIALWATLPDAAPAPTPATAHRQQCSPEVGRAALAAEACTSPSDAQPTSTPPDQLLAEAGSGEDSEASDDGSTDSERGTLSQRAAPACEVEEDKLPGPARARQMLCSELRKYWCVHGAGAGPCVAVHCLRDTADLLERVWPSWVILFDSAPDVVRRIEVFSAQHGSNWPIKVFMLSGMDTTAHQRVLTDLELEHTAFSLLIRDRRTFAVQNTNEDDDAAEAADWTPQRRTARAGGLSERLRMGAQARRVICDLREFRSTLPSALHRSRSEVVAAHLDVADYVLSPDTAVERKSVTDLVGSMQSGRLLQQAQRLCRRFAKPVVLIEFDSRLPFSLDAHLPGAAPQQHTRRWGSRMSTLEQGANRAGRKRALQRQIAHLVVLHPPLRLLWSHGPTMSARLFATAKRGRPEPTVDRSTDVPETMAAARNLLTRLPGVDEGGAKRLTEQCATLADIVRLPLPVLQSLIGGQNGAELHMFLHSTS
eukprot:TRINITY_DN28753_c0_g1_i1.p1 TRINITY_DN28753_c0_g1~~TRINITY_DN28753_c0_g1_i1.p1  ORF type:complete len:970 (+),score=249.38 TRINITY_DN28753_c0_g1_i1:44-2911(+)